MDTMVSTEFLIVFILPEIMRSSVPKATGESMQPTPFCEGLLIIVMGVDFTLSAHQL
jgi:hypothetical protein